MINRKKRKYANTIRLNYKKCCVNSKNIFKQQHIVKRDDKKYVKLLLLIIISSVTSYGSLLLILKSSFGVRNIVYKYKSFNVGQRITLKDGLDYYCINNCGSNDRNIILLNANVLDLNNDSIIDDNDKVVFDENNSIIYDTTDKNNIAYIIKKIKSDNIYIKECRLLRSSEYVNIRNTMSFGYDWDEGNWLSNENIDSWWLETPKVNSVLAVTKRGTYKLSSPTDKNYIRPVVETLKEYIK